MTEPIVDFHVHIFADKIAEKATRATCDHYRFPSEVVVGDAASLRESVGDCPIAYMVVHATATKPHQVSSINDFLTGLDDPRFLPFGTMHPYFDGDITAELARAKKNGIRGIKLHPDFQAFYADDRAAYPIYEAAGALDLVVLTHAGDPLLDYSHPRRIARAARDFPDVTFVAAHFGGREQWEDAVEYLADLPNVLVDSSSTIAAIGAAKTDHLIRAFGAERVLFGTDFPMASHAMELRRFHYLTLSPRERRMILFDNAATLLKL